MNPCEEIQIGWTLLDWMGNWPSLSHSQSSSEFKIQTQMSNSVLTSLTGWGRWVNAPHLHVAMQT